MVLANPPFGGKERKEVQQNFPIRTGETAFLFLQHFIKMLKAGGRGGVVIKNTFLSNTDNASVSLRKLLLESCNLHTVLDCPGGTFQGAGVKTVVLFFEKGAPTRKVWFYQLDPGRNLGKTNPLNDDDLAEFVKLQKTFADSPKSVERGRQEHRPDDLRPLREEPERRRGSRRTAARRRSWTKSPRWTPRARRCWRTSRRCYEERMADKDAWRDVCHSDRQTARASKDQTRSATAIHLRSTNVETIDVRFGRASIILSEATVEELRKYMLRERRLSCSRTVGACFGKLAYLSEATDGSIRDQMRLRVLRPKQVDPRVSLLLLFRLDELLASDARTAAVSAQADFNASNLSDLTIPVPPLPEQQRIVGILDEAFEGIATAKANAEKNLQNARALFESHLQSVFTQRGEGWVETTLERDVRLITAVTAMRDVDRSLKSDRRRAEANIRTTEHRGIRATMSTEVYIFDDNHRCTISEDW